MVVGFEVTDLAQAVAELRAAGIELLGEPGLSWQHFRGPDGNVYELVALTRPYAWTAEPATSLSLDLRNEFAEGH